MYISMSSSPWGHWSNCTPILALDRVNLHFIITMRTLIWSHTYTGSEHFIITIRTPIWSYAYTVIGLSEFTLHHHYEDIHLITYIYWDWTEWIYTSSSLWGHSSDHINILGLDGVNLHFIITMRTLIWSHTYRGSGHFITTMRTLIDLITYIYWEWTHHHQHVVCVVTVKESHVLLGYNMMLDQGRYSYNHTTIANKTTELVQSSESSQINVNGKRTFLFQGKPYVLFLHIF